MTITDDEKYHPKRMHPQAVGRVILEAGSVNPGVLSMLEEYEYTKDERDDMLWWMPDTEPTGLMFSDDWSEVAIIGTNESNFENLNWLLTRSGWASARIASCSAKVEETLFMELKSIEVVEEPLRFWDDDPKSAPATPDAPVAAPTAAPAAPTEQTPLFTGTPPASPLTAPKAAAIPVTATPAEPKPDHSAAADLHELAQLRGQVQDLQAKLARQVQPASAREDGLITIIERYLLSRPDTTLQPQLIGELRAVGYEVRLAIVRT